jgi:hypothetical protein
MWADIGLQEYDDGVGAVAEGPILLRVGQCWLGVGMLCATVYELLAIQCDMVDARVWKTTTGKDVTAGAVLMTGSDESDGLMAAASLCSLRTVRIRPGDITCAQL